MMGDLIDRAAVLQAIEVAQASLMINDSVLGEVNRKYYKGLAWAHRVIDDATTAAVRCKDCKHMIIKPFNARFCCVWNDYNGMGDEGFCNYGERREDNA